MSIEPYSAQWANNPEPNQHTLDPRTILDANIEGQVWLYNYEKEGTEWLVYRGETEELSR